MNGEVKGSLLLLHPSNLIFHRAGGRSLNHYTDDLVGSGVLASTARQSRFSSQINSAHLNISR
jgi:hypothetical protein